MSQIISQLLEGNRSDSIWIQKIPVLGDLLGNPESLDYLDVLDTEGASNGSAISIIDQEVREEWSSDGNNNVTLTGAIQVPSNVEVEVGGLGVRFGNPSQESVDVAFSIELPRAPLLKLSAVWVAGEHDIDIDEVKDFLENGNPDIQEEADIQGEAKDILIKIKERGESVNFDDIESGENGTGDNGVYLDWGDQKLRLSFEPQIGVPEAWIKRGKIIKENGNGDVTDVNPVDSGQNGSALGPISPGEVSFLLSMNSMEIDAKTREEDENYFEVEEISPLIIDETGVALRLKGVTWYFDGIPSGERPSDLNLPEDWRGVVVEDIEVWGLSRLLPILPEKQARESEQISELTLSNWAIDSGGIRGDVTLKFSDDDRTVRPKKVEVSYTGEWWPERFVVKGCLDAGGLVQEQEHLLDFVGDLRLTPPKKETDSDGWSMEFSLSGTQQSDGTIVSLKELSGLGDSLGQLAQLTGGNGSSNGKKKDATLLLGAFDSLNGEGLIEFNELALDGITAQVRQRTYSDGTNGTKTYRELNLDLDVRADCTLKLQDAIDSDLLDEGIDKIPLGFTAGDIPISYALDVPDLPSTPDFSKLTFAESVLNGEKSGWSFADGLSLSIPGTVDLAGMVTLTEVDLRGLHKSVDAPNVDIDGIDGLKMSFGLDSSGSGDVAVGRLPDVIDIIYYPKVEEINVGEVDFPGFGIDIQVGRVGQPVSLLVPGALYAQGELSTNSDKFDNPFPEFDGEWGNLLAGRIEAFLVGNGSALDAPKMRSSYNFDLELDILSATRKSDGLQLFILNLESSFEPGLPLGTSGAAVYGLGLLFAQNGKPDREGEELSYGDWYLDTDPKYTTSPKKWQAAPGHWGFGVSTSLGSSADGGRSWNASAGLILLLPGPKILVAGRGNLFSKRSKLPAEGGNAEDPPFAAILALDFQRNRFSADLEADFEVGDDGKVLDAEIPATVRVDLDDPSDFLLALGKAELGQQPVETPQRNEQFRGRVFDLIDVNAFLLLSGKDVELGNERFGADKPILPGVALAYGVAGSFEWDFSAGPLSIALRAHAGYAVGASMTVPLLAGLVWIEGGVKVKAFGVGASMEASIDLDALISEPKSSEKDGLFQLNGTVHVALGLPWPASDIEMNADLLIGEKDGTWLGNAPKPEIPLDSVSFWDRGVGDPLVLPVDEEPSSEDTPRVPLDAVIDINFRAPVGNNSAQLGSFIVNGEDTNAKVWEVASTDKAGDEEVKRGYRHRIEECRLKKKKESGTWEEVLPQSSSGSNNLWPAFWKAKMEAGTAAGALPEDSGTGEETKIETTKGEQPARTRLRLMGPLAGSVEARVGQGEDVMREKLGGWSPCQRGDVFRGGGGTNVYSTVPPDKWKAESLPSGTKRSLSNLKPPLDTPAQLRIQSSSPQSKVIQRQMGVRTGEPRIVNNPVDRGEIGTSDSWGDADLPGDVETSNPLWKVLLDAPKLLLSPPPDEGQVQPAIDIDEEDPSASNPWVLASQKMLGRARIGIPESTKAKVRVLVAKDERLVNEENGQASVVPLCWAVRPDGSEDLLPVVRSDSSEVDDGNGNHFVIKEFNFDAQDFEDEKPITGIYLAAVGFDFHPNLTSSSDSDRLPMASLLDIRCKPTRLAGYADALDSSREATSGVVSRLVEQRTEWGEGGDAGLLEPDTTYKLVVKGTSFPASMEERGQNQPEVNKDANWENGECWSNGNEWSKEFEFRTEADPPTDLKAYEGEAVHPPAVNGQDDREEIHRLAEKESLEARWEVATTPADGAKAYYLPNEDENPVTVRLREMCKLAVFRAFGRDLEIRVIDENGNVHGEEIDFKAVPAKDLMGPQEAMRNHLLSQNCLNDGDINPLWQEALKDVTMGLKSNTRYVGELRAVDGDQESTLHRWRFQTSRYTGLEDHLDSHVELDEDSHVELNELVPNTHSRLGAVDSEAATVQEALQNKVPNLDDFTVNDDLLDRLLFTRLGLSPRKPPSEPELVTIWAWQPEEEMTTSVGLVLDGPEPLLRSSSNGEASVSLEIVVESPAAPNIDVPTKVVTGQSRARAVILADWSDQASGSEIIEFPANDYRLTVTSRGNEAVKEFSIPESPFNRDGDG